MIAVNSSSERYFQNIYTYTLLVVLCQFLKYMFLRKPCELMRKHHSIMRCLDN